MKNKTEDFYKGQFFEQITAQINEVKKLVADHSAQDLKNQYNMEKKLDKLNSKVAYIYGFAGAIGFGSTFVIEWLKAKLMGQ